MLAVKTTCICTVLFMQESHLDNRSPHLWLQRYHYDHRVLSNLANADTDKEAQQKAHKAEQEAKTANCSIAGWR